METSGNVGRGFRKMAETIQEEHIREEEKKIARQWNSDS
jgi:hypothetical protein